MNTPNRRTFVIHAMAAGGAMACGHAMAGPVKFDESEAKAVSLGYKHDSAQVDKKRFPQAHRRREVQQLHGLAGQAGRPLGRMRPDFRPPGVQRRLVQLVCEGLIAG